MKFRAVFFDLGGVLVRTVDRLPRQQLAARLGTTAEALEELVYGGEQGRRAQCGEISAEAQWAYACRTVGWPLSRLTEFRAEFYRGDLLDEDLVGYIRSLRPHYRLGLISNAMSDARRFVEQEAHIADVFDHLTFSFEVGVMKPQPAIFQAALQGLKVQPAEAVFVDDSLPNVVGAQAVGMTAIHFRTPEQIKAELAFLMA